MTEAVAAGLTVLTPSAELATALSDALERHARARGLEVWATPRIRDAGGWLRERHARRQLREPSVARCLSDIEERELWRAVIGGDSAQALLDPAAAARAARRARRTLQEYAIPLAAVEAEGTEETQAFTRWNREFDLRCRDLKCISADALLGQLPQSEEIAWIDNTAWRPVLRQWLTRQGRMLTPLAPHAAQAAAASRSVLRWQLASPEAEFAAMAEWARAGLQADAGFRAWVCVPQLRRRRSQVIDACDAALAPQRYGVAAHPVAAPYAVAGGTPLADYAPVRAALALLSASVGSVGFSRFSELLRAPDLQATQLEAVHAAALDVALRRRAPSEADLPSWLDLAEEIAAQAVPCPVPALQRLRAAWRALAGGSRGERRFSAWIPAWLAALEAAPWAWRSRWSSIEYQAAERFRELLAGLATGDSVFGSRSRESAQRLLERAARDTAFQPQTGVPALWVSSQLHDPWLSYDGVWVAGCDDEHWPPPVDPVPLIPVALQRRHGVIEASAESQLQLARHLQTRWQARAPHCVFSLCDPGDGASSLPSRLLPQDGEWRNGAASAASPRPHWRAVQETAPRLESCADERAPPVAHPERTRGVSTLRAQSQCAFRGFAHTRLQTERLDLPQPGFNERERGELTHHALEWLWRELRDSSSLHALTPDAQATLMGAAAAHAVTLARRIHDPGPRWCAREVQRLVNLLTLWLDAERCRAPFSVEFLEDATRVVGLSGLEFRVRIDRVDRLADGARVLIDYKTGAAHTDWRGDRPDNPQLPIYAMALPEALVAVAYGRVNAADPGFVFESQRADIFRPLSRPTGLEGLPDFAALIALWSRRLDAIAADFAAGQAQVAPMAHACRSCHLHGLCRVEHPDD